MKKVFVDEENQYYAKYDSISVLYRIIVRSLCIQYRIYLLKTPFALTYNTTPIYLFIT